MATFVNNGNKNVEVRFYDVTGIIGPIVDRNMRELFADVMVEVAKEGTPFDTGNNRSAIGVLEGSNGSYAIGTTSGYGGYLEFGTKRMPARPYFLPAADAAKKNIESTSERDWQS
jgi:HK97 gp10 family phage protein